jgi:hypothetical protein
LQDAETVRAQTRERVRRFRDKQTDVTEGNGQKPQAEGEAEGEGEESKTKAAVSQENVKGPPFAASLFGSVSKPPVRYKASKQEAEEVWKLVAAEPEEFQRTCMALMGRLLKAGEKAGVVRSCIEHYQSHRELVKSPYAYYAPGGEGLDWVKQKSRLAGFDAEWAAEKKAAAEGE